MRNSDTLNHTIMSKVLLNILESWNVGNLVSWQQRFSLPLHCKTRGPHPVSEPLHAAREGALQLQSCRARRCQSWVLPALCVHPYSRGKTSPHAQGSKAWCFSISPASSAKTLFIITLKGCFWWKDTKWELFPNLRSGRLKDTIENQTAKAVELLLNFLIKNKVLEDFLFFCFVWWGFQVI